ncbi:MAG: outer membrane beta-barrel protein, partial [Candidatus Hydrogenedentes bacterium]|nr:outer membrane beta-barrel protein [Candidatus Hydrogenedentota bacterium]
MHSYEYEDSFAGGARIDNSIRDRDHQSLYARLSYGVSDDYDLFVQAETSRRRYDQDALSFRNSDAREYQLGMAVNFSGKAKGDFYVGHLVIFKLLQIDIIVDVA